MNQSRARLIKELAGLRKGEGMTLSKLQGKTVIRAIVGRATNTPPDSITNSQVYNFLLTELSNLAEGDSSRALRNALGINASEGRLAVRRSHLATSLGKHPDTIERYENQAIDDLAVYLMDRAHSLAHMAQSIAPYPSSLYVQELEEQARMARRMTATSLSSHLSLGKHGEDFMTYLELSRRPYLEANVHLTLHPSARGEGWYRFKLSCTFQGARETFRVAVVLDANDGERLMSTGLIDDFHQLNNVANFSREIKAITASSKLILRNPKENTQKLIRLHELDGERATQLLQSTGKVLAQPCWFLEGIIPEDWQSEDVIHEHQSNINLRTDENYAYWYSPALMYLKKLTFDFSEFPDADKRAFFLQPFLGHTPGTVLKEKHLYTLLLNNWIMPGHGIVLVWRDTGKLAS